MRERPMTRGAARAPLFEDTANVTVRMDEKKRREKRRTRSFWRKRREREKKEEKRGGGREVFGRGVFEEEFVGGV